MSGYSAALAALSAFGTLGTAHAEADLSGVWGMVQHSRPGGPFFVPVEAPLSELGQEITGDFAARYDVVTYEPNAYCVEAGMPTIMWGIGGAMMEIVQQPDRITLLSELVNQSRRVFLDGREIPADFPHQRVGYSVGHWEDDTLVIETELITKWHGPRWPHSDKFRVVERWWLEDPDNLELTGFRGGGPRLEIPGPILVNEMTMSDPKFYVNDEELLTIYYRQVPDQVLFEDNCPEYIWMELLEERSRDTD